MEVAAVRFVGGFARAGSVTSEEYTEAKPDPIMAFGGHVAQHMNDDHMHSTIAMVEHYIPGLKGDKYVQAAEITSLDSLGMYVKITRDPENEDRLPGQPKQFKLRLPFPRPAEDRKDVKTLIVEMTQASAAKEEETA
jgi:putative heme iron utilization protein